MAEESQAPSTNDRNWNAKMEYSRPSRPGYPAPRRVATAPIPLSTQFAAASPPSDGVVETLYNHPNAKIISFTASGRAFSRSLGRSSVLPIDDEPGTLSWSSQLERTIAVGKNMVFKPNESCGLTEETRPLSDLSSAWFCCFSELRLSFTANPSQKSVLVHRRGQQQIYPANSSTQLLEDRAPRFRPRRSASSSGPEGSPRSDTPVRKDRMSLQTVIYCGLT